MELPARKSKMKESKKTDSRMDEMERYEPPRPR